MSAQQSVIAAGGSALVVLAFWTGPGRAAVSGGLFTSSPSDAQTQAAHKELTKLAGAVLFVVALTLLGGISRTWGNAMIAIVSALLILWTMNHYSSTSSTQKGAHR